MPSPKTLSFQERSPPAIAIGQVQFSIRGNINDFDAESRGKILVSHIESYLNDEYIIQMLLRKNHLANQFVIADQPIIITNWQVVNRRVKLGHIAV